MTLQELIEKIRNDLETNPSWNEVEVYQRIIWKLLHALGWRPTQLVAFEYDLKGRRVNFELGPSLSKPIVFIIDGSDGQLTKEQPFEYAAHKGVPIAVLTDGRKWHFFHPPGQGNYKQRKVYELDLMEDEEGA